MRHSLTDWLLWTARANVALTLPVTAAIITYMVIDAIPRVTQQPAPGNIADAWGLCQIFVLSAFPIAILLFSLTIWFGDSDARQKSRADRRFLFASIIGAFSLLTFTTLELLILGADNTTASAAAISHPAEVAIVIWLFVFTPARFIAAFRRRSGFILGDRRPSIRLPIRRAALICSLLISVGSLRSAYVGSSFQDSLLDLAARRQTARLDFADTFGSNDRRVADAIAQVIRTEIEFQDMYAPKRPSFCGVANPQCAEIRAFGFASAALAALIVALISGSGIYALAISGAFAVYSEVTVMISVFAVFI